MAWEFAARQLVVTVALVVAVVVAGGCSAGDVQTSIGQRVAEASGERSSSASEAAVDDAGGYFATIGVGQELPSDETCARLVRENPRPEIRPENVESNGRAGGPSVLIDGAHGFRNDELSQRISGDFTGSTEDILRWAACKWGIDEELTRARAWTESSWSIDTTGDRNDEPAVCALIGLEAPCDQSHGLLQVKGTVHEDTYPHSSASTAWGVDYAMAWQRACFEGAFTWLDDQGYEAGDLQGCVGAWFSGEWYDELALGYLEDVGENLAKQRWLN